MLRGKTEAREVTTRHCMICGYENLRICGTSHAAYRTARILGRCWIPECYHIEVARMIFHILLFVNLLKPRNLVTFPLYYV